VENVTTRISSVNCNLDVFAEKLRTYPNGINSRRNMVPNMKSLSEKIAEKCIDLIRA
jgi:hypothetical protein